MKKFADLLRSLGFIVKEPDLSKSIEDIATFIDERTDGELPEEIKNKDGVPEALSKIEETIIKHLN